jgi:hypothetical protein
MRSATIPLKTYRKRPFEGANGVGGANMQNVSNKRAPSSEEERGQGPLWFAIAGLLIVIFSRSMADEMIGDVVAWVGAAFTLIGLFYWFVRPKHGL